MSATDLLAIGERASGSRSFLLVSKVLGKHIPVPAAICRLAGTALALRVAGDPRAAAARAALGGGDAAPAGVAGPAGDVAAAARILADVAASPPAAMRDATVIGFAETATGLGHQVAEALDAAWLQNTTRHPDCAGQVAFDESHSHARDQWLRFLPEDLPDGPLVIVDDELSTGATAAKLIALLPPRSRCIVACLVDARREPGPLEELGVEVVSLERLGELELPAPGWSAGALPTQHKGGQSPFKLRDVVADWPCPRERHGLDREGRRAFRELAASLAEPGALVLGCGEHLALPQLAALASGPETLVSSTTRSPALVSERGGYPLAHGLAFPHPEAPELPGYAYNVGVRPRIVVHFSEPAHRQAADGLLRALGGPVTAVTLR